MNNPLISALHFSEKIEEMLIESGGLITAEIEQELKLNPQTITELVDQKYISLERLEISQEFFEKKSEDFKRIAHSLKSAEKFIKESIKQYMIENNKKELVGNEYVFKLSPGKPTVEVMDESKIPESYFKTETVSRLSKDLISDDLKMGIPVDGAILKESYTLRKSINKAAKWKQVNQ